MLVDVGIIGNHCKDFVIDRSKIRRERHATRQINTELHNRDCGEALYFDGKIDKTLKIFGNKTKQCKEEHIVLVREPNSEYVGHITPASGSAQHTTEAIIDFFDHDLSKLLAVGSDGTAVNTGPHGGIIRLLELEINRPVQWIICLLHFNELPLRAYFKFLDGETSGPKNYIGPIGKAIVECEKIPPVDFIPIISQVSDGKF